MPHVFQGDIAACQQARFAIVVSRYNESITKRLLDGAVETLLQHGISADSIDVTWVPGAWEIPVATQRMARSQKYSAILCLGAVIRGETTHDRHINQQVSHSLGRVAMDFDLPVSFGVLTCNSVEQAIHRSGGKVGNKGVECAEAALEMADLMRKLPKC